MAGKGTPTGTPAGGCPHCGVPLPDLTGRPGRPTVDELLDEVAALRSTVARLRGSGFTGARDRALPDLPRR